MENNKMNGLFIDDWVLQLEDLTLTAEMLLASILDLSQESGYCYPTNAYFVGTAGNVSAKTIENYINNQWK